MSLISMAVSGLKSFASNVKNTVVSAVSSVGGALLGIGAGLVGSYMSNKFSSLNSYISGSTDSTAGNYRAGGNSSENSIFDFITNFKFGVMKSSRFRAEFNLPKGVTKGSASIHSVNVGAISSNIKTNGDSFNKSGQINVKCHTATFPSRQIDTQLFKSNSVSFRVPWAATYEPITLTFYADGNMDSREYFELWQSAVMNFGNNTSNFYNEYVSDVKLYLQNDYGADTYGIILYECYPVTISQLELGAANTNTPLNVMVTLTFKSWMPMSNTNSAKYNRTV